VIISVNQSPVKTSADLTKVVGAARSAGRPTVLVQVQRGTGRPVYLGIRIREN